MYANKIEYSVLSISGQGQTKASKKREANGEPSPSPKKEAKKSPKRSSKSSRSSRSSGTPSTETPSSGGKDLHALEIEERQDSPRLRHARDSHERETVVKSESKRDSHSNGKETIVNDVEEVPRKQTIESPPKPKRTYEVGFIEQEKENVPENVSEIKSSPKTPIKMNGELEPEPFTPVHMNSLNHISPQATSTPHPNGTLSTGQRGSGGQYSKYFFTEGVSRNAKI